MLLALLGAPPATVLAIMLSSVVYDFTAGGGVSGVTLGQALRSYVFVSLFVSIFYGYPLVLMLGLPLYHVLSRRIGYGAIPAILAGVLTTTLPCCVVMAQFVESLTPVNIGVLATAVTAGCFGGLVFWYVAVWRDPRFTQASNFGTKHRAPP